MKNEETIEEQLRDMRISKDDPKALKKRIEELEDKVQELKHEKMINQKSFQDDILKVAENPFILSYDDFGKKLINKSNEIFKGTEAEIALRNRGEVKESMFILKRLALITTLANNLQLQSYNLWPITPLQSELLLKENKLPNQGNYDEDLALILYDRSFKGYNHKEAQALYESLKQNKDQLGLSNKDLGEKLLIINAGLKVDPNMDYGVKPIILPGITQVYAHETLKKTTAIEYNFKYGLEYGLPNVHEIIDKSSKLDLSIALKDDEEFYRILDSRSLSIPSENNLGLLVLCRDLTLYLSACARSQNLANFGAKGQQEGRITFAYQEAS